MFLAGVAVLVALRRKRLALPAILVAVAAGAVYVAASSSIYYTAKTYQVAAFPIACAVVAGAAALTRCPWRPQSRPVPAAGALAARRLSPPPWSWASARPRGRPRSRLPSSASSRRSVRDTPHSRGLALIHDDWTKVLLPDAAVPYDGSFGANVRPGYGVAGNHGHRLDPARLPQARALDRRTPARRHVVPAGALPPPAGVAGLRLLDACAWPSSSARLETTPLERRDTLGGRTPREGPPVIVPQTGLLEGRAADGTVAFPVQWKLPGSAWCSWVATPRLRRSVPGRRAVPRGTTFDLGVAGRYAVLADRPAQLPHAHPHRRPGAARRRPCRRRA